MNTSNKSGSNVVAGVDVRETMSKLPKPIQWFLTWLTGKPLEGQSPLIRRTNLSHFFTAYLWLFAGITLATYAYMNAQYWLVPCGWLLTVSGARKIIPTINHYCVHGDLLPPWLRDRFNWLHPYIADFNSSVLFLQDFKAYKEEHLSHHKISVVASIIDPDMAFMWQLGFKPGMSKQELWKVLINNIVNPVSKLHRLFFATRIKTTFRRSTWFRCMVQLITVSLLVLFALITSPLTVIASVIIPMSFFYHAASLLQFASEHLWMKDAKDDGLLTKKGSQKSLIARSKMLTNARFCGEPLMINDQDSGITKFRKWSLWLARMTFIHLPTRLFVLSGDLVVHDWHHRCGFGADWANAFYARAAMCEKLKDTDHPLTEVWGLKNALDLVFENLSKMEEIDPELIENDPDAIMGM